MFVISLKYICDISEIEKYLPEHIEYLERHYEAGHFIASGRKVPRTGGVILAVAETEEEIDKILSEDPFKVHNLAEYEVTQFIPTKTSKELSFLAQ
jgi:uncharacterized protein YciI